MNKDITFCGNRKCPYTDCLRFHKNAPYDVLSSWFATKPNIKDGKCDYYLK